MGYHPDQRTHSFPTSDFDHCATTKCVLKHPDTLNRHHWERHASPNIVKCVVVVVLNFIELYFIRPQRRVGDT